MKKVKIKFVERRVITRVDRHGQSIPTMVFDYVIISGYVKQYTTDRYSNGVPFDLPNEHNYKGRPRYTSSTYGFNTGTLERHVAKDGYVRWIVDDRFLI